MTEVEAMAAKLGLDLPISIDQRIAAAGRVGEHKTSMLQEIEAVVELGAGLGVPMPCTNAVYEKSRSITPKGIR
jgi:2-dehydropantoate 2-reductase